MDEKHVLLFNIPPRNFDLGASFLAREPFRAETCSSVEELLSHTGQTAYKLIVLQLPLGGFEPRDILYAVRQEKHPSRKAILVVLCPDDKMAEYRPYLTKGVSALFPLSAPAAHLETALGVLLKVAPRVSMRIMVRLNAQVHQMASKHLCQVLNISRTGMFVATNLNLPGGTEVAFELLIPGQPSPVAGEAQVAWHSRGVGGASTGLGLKFTSFKDDGHARFDAFFHAAAPKE